MKKLILGLAVVGLLVGGILLVTDNQKTTATNIDSALIAWYETPAGIAYETSGGSGYPPNWDSINSGSSLDSYGNYVPAK